MFKNLLQQVTKVKDRQLSETFQFPQFDELAIRQFKKIDSDDLWKIGLDDLLDNIKYHEQYLDTLRNNYDELLLQLKPLLSKFQMMEQERKRLTQTIQEKDNFIHELEGMLQQQRDLLQNNKSGKDIIQQQSEIQQQDEMIQQQIQSYENQLQQYKDRQIEQDQYVNQLLQQLIDLQTKQRNDRTNHQRQQEQLQQEILNLKTQQKQTDSLDSQLVSCNLQLDSLQEQLKDMESIINAQKIQITQLNQDLQDNQQKINSGLVAVQNLQQKREKAIEEIQILHQKLQQKGQFVQSYSLSIDNVKQIKYNLQNSLINQRRQFDQFYKKYLNNICLSIKTPLPSLMGNEINELIIALQDLIDYIDDVIP